MPLREAVKFLKGAFKTSTVYSFHDGRCWVRSERAFASYPVAHILGTFALAAPDLEKAMGRMDSEPIVEPGDGTMVLRAGRLRSSIDLLAAEGPAPSDEGGWDDLVTAPTKLLEALARALPFVSAEGTWQRSVLLATGSLAALSNHSAARVLYPELELPDPIAIPSESADYLIGLGAEPTRWLIDPNSVRFEWPSGARVRCQLFAEGWPGVADRVLGMADAEGAEPPVAVTDEWREAYDDAAALGSGELVVSPKDIVSRSDHGEHRIEFPTGVSRETKWSLSSLKAVLAVATRWDPDGEGPARFVGDAIRGIVARR